MTREEWHRRQQAFFAALELPRSERTAYLNSLDDDLLRQEVERLLDAHESTRDLPSSSHIHLPGGSSVTAGTRLGSWEVERLVGQGGSGSVYLARRADGEFDQKVAIKVIFGTWSSGPLLRRFAQERQILAACNHPHIARILDAGSTTGGLPFLVMDYVDGVPINHYCEASALDLKQRLQLFRQCLEGAAYIHQRGIIHRDLKPSNMFVDTTGAVKILDFGVAKILDPSLSPISDTSVQILTPEYASPEQFAGLPATVTTDIYSLGAVLYELIAGRKPHDITGLGYLDAAERVRREPVAPPSSYSRWSAAVRGDLDTVLLKALARRPEDRYPTVQAFAEDIQRYLDGEPVLARRSPWWHKVRLKIRRYPLAFALAILTVTTIASSSALWISARQDAKRIEAERRNVRELLESVLGDLMTRIEDLPGSTPARRVLVERARKTLSDISSFNTGDETLQLDQARAFLKLGDVEGNPFEIGLGERERARTHYTTALAQLEKLHRTNPGSLEIRFQLAQAYQRMGDLNASPMAFLNPKQAVQWYQKSSDILPNRRDLVALRFRGLLEERWAYGCRLASNRDDAQRHFAESVRIRREVLAQDPGDIDAKRELINAQQRYSDGMDAQQAILVYRQTIPVLRELLRERPSSVKTKKSLGRAQSVLGYHLIFRQGWIEAEAQLQAAVRLLEEIANSDSEVGNTTLEVELMRARHRLGLTLVALGRLVEADSLRQTSDDRMRQVESKRPQPQLPKETGGPIDGRSECAGMHFAADAFGSDLHLEPGDLLVTDLSANALIRIGRQGEQGVLASGGWLEQPIHSALLQSGSGILTIAWGAAGSKPRLVAIERDSESNRWSQRAISCGGILQRPTWVHRGEGTKVFVLDEGAPNAYRGRLLEIDLKTGMQRTLSSPHLLASPPKAIWLSPKELAVTSFWGTEGGPSDVVAIDIESGMQRYLSRFGLMDDPIGIAQWTPTELVVGDANVDLPGWSALIAIDIKSGRQRRLRPMREFHQIEEVIVLDRSSAIVLDSGQDQWKPHIWEVDLLSNRKRLIAQEGLMRFPKAVLYIPQNGLRASNSER